MIELASVTLEGHGVRLEPLGPEHVEGLRDAAADGEQWRLFFTYVPAPPDVEAYVEEALRGQHAGHMLPWAVREVGTSRIIGSTRYHDVVPAIDRVEIGYTWYASSWQRTHVNTACKLLLLEHAFDVVGCGVVGWRTDVFNHRSQRAIERLGAKRDGVLRHHSARRDGSPRDDVFYSVLAHEWGGVRKHLETLLWRHRSS